MNLDGCKGENTRARILADDFKKPETFKNLTHLKSLMHSKNLTLDRL